MTSKTKDETFAAKAVESSTTSAPDAANLLRTACDPALTEDLALALLKHSDLPAEVLEQLAKNSSTLKSRKVKMALTSHPHAPRHVSVPLARQLYTFDLMKVTLSRGAPVDIKVAIDDVLISRLKTITVGERLTLARRATGRVAAALLLNLESRDSKAVDAKKKKVEAEERETRVMRAALDNPRLTEALVINSVLRSTASTALVDAVARHVKWSPRREIRAALLRTEHLSLARALEFSDEIPAPLLREILASSRLPARIKAQIIRQLSE
jgi:hypothetical protein